ncbi:MAG: hypothetical protein LUG55_02060, partial [Clostridiales bacterium]|nr:hypothetical protein [Clostridiales bacterium]
EVANINSVLAGNVGTGTLQTVHLTADSAAFTDLTAEVANINSVLAGNVGTGTLQTVHLTASNVVIDDAIITDAMIADLSADKISAGTIITDYVTIQSESGNLYITDNTIQIQDGTTVRVQIGEDASGDYNLYLWDASGVLIWDAQGLTEAGLTGNGAIIKDVAVADDANISGYKIDITTMTSALNEYGELVVDATQITIDDTTLDYKLSSMTTSTAEAQAAADAAAELAAALESEAVASLTQYYALGASAEEPPSDPAEGVTRAAALVDTAVVDESRVDITYADTDWATEWIVASDGLYLWTAFFVEYADGHTEWTTPACLSDGVARESISTLVTELEVVQGQITAKVWQTDIDTAVDEVNGTITTLQDQYAQLIIDLDSISLSVGDLTTTVSDNYEALSSQISALTVTASEITAPVSELEQTVEDNYSTLDGKITTISETADGISAEVSSLQSTVSSNYTTLSSRITTVETTASGISATVDNLQTTVTENYTDLSDQISALTVTANGITETVSALQSTVAGNYETLSSQITTVETTASGISATVSELQSTVTSNYETLSSQITTVEATASGITATVSELQSTVSSNYTELDDKIATLTLTTDGITASLSTVTTATATAQATADAAAAAAAALESESVTSLTQYYALGPSAEEPPSDPADNVTRAIAVVDTAIVDESRVDIVYSDTDWTTERPTASDGLYLWTSFYVVYVDGGAGWTTPTCISDDVARSAISTLQTDLEIVQGQITAKVWLTDITEATDALGADITTLQDQYTAVTQTIAGIETEIGDITTTVSDNYTTLNSRITTVSETADGISSTVSSLQTTVETNYTDLSSKITTVSETADGITATVSSLQTTVGSNYTELSDKISSLEVTADDITASVSSVQGGLSALTDTVNGTVTNAVTYFAISGDTSPPCDPGETIIDATVDTAVVDSALVGCIGWTTERLEAGEDEYLWTCNQLALADGSTVWTTPVLVTDDYARTSVATLAVTTTGITATVSDLQSTVSGNYTNLSDKIAALTVTTDSITATVSDLTTTVADNYDTLSDQITAVETTASGISATVSSLQSTVTANYTDLSSQITTLEATASGISARVTQTESDISANAASITTLSSELTQLADSIALCVTTDADTGYLRLGAGDDGTVKFTVDTDNLTIDEDGNVSMAGKVTATSGTIGGWTTTDTRIKSSSTVALNNAEAGLLLVNESDKPWIQAQDEDGSTTFRVARNGKVTMSGNLTVADTITMSSDTAYITGPSRVYIKSIVYGESGFVVPNSDGTDGHGYYAKDADGSNICLLRLNDSNILSIGNSSYSTRIYGSSIYVNGYATKHIVSIQSVSVSTSGTVDNGSSGSATGTFTAVSGASYLLLPQRANYGYVTEVSYSGTTVTATIYNASGSSHTLAGNVVVLAYV